MARRIDALDLPPGYVEISRDWGGSRNRFAAPPAPYVSRTFATPWRDGALCDDVETLARSLGTLELHEPLTPDGSGQYCHFRLWIGSGWRARLVGVFRYRLFLQAKSRSLVRRHTTDAKCRAELRRLGSEGTLGRGITGGRSVGCWLAPDHGLVEMRVTGKLAE